MSGDRSFKPQVGQTLFMAFQNEKPFIATITGFHHDQRFSSEKFDHMDRNGRKNSSCLSSYRFFPEAPVDSQYVYCVVHQSMEDKYWGEDRYFFDPKAAFEHLKALKSGVIKPRMETSDDSEYHVYIEEAE